jgi:sugar/nucleoside kinase (ribokinase family)
MPGYNYCNGRQRNSLNIASILSAEADEFEMLGGCKLVDILSINIDEAKSIAGIVGDISDVKYIVDECIDALINRNPAISVLITNGPFGSYCYHHSTLEFTPALIVSARSTAGAGDAFLAGTIAGLCCGLPLTKGTNDTHFSETPLASAVELGGLLASLSVTSQDTIYTTANAALLYEYATTNYIRFNNDFLIIFKDCVG